MAFLLAFAALAALATPASAALEPEWVEETPLGSPRAQAVVVESDGMVYVIGGVSTMVYSTVTDVNTYDLETGAWDSVEPMLLAVRGASGAVGNDGRIYVFGGDTGGEVTSVVQIYDPELDVWTYGASMPIGVWQGRAAVDYSGRIHVAGGFTSAWTNTDALQTYDPDADSWSYGWSLPGARSGGTFTAFYGGYALVYTGGSSSSWYDATTNVWMYYVDYDYWYSLSDMPEPLANHAAVFGTDSCLYVMGGGPDGYNTNPAYSSTYRYSYGEDLWYEGPEMPVEARNLGAVATADGRVYIVGGNDDAEVLDQVHSLQVAWSELSMPVTLAAQGGYLTLEVAYEFAFIEPENVYIGAFMESDTGTVYASWDFGIPAASSAVVGLDLPESVPAGDYEVVVYYFEVYASGNYVDLPLESFAVTVVDGANLEEMIQELEAALADLQTDMADSESALLERIAELEDQIDALQDALEQTNTDIGGVQTSVDDKLGAVLGYAIMGLLVVVIVLLLVMMMMGRKAAPPPPSA